MCTVFVRTVRLYIFQDMLEHAMISIQSGRNKSSLPGVSLQQMPYPCYIEDRFVIAIARTFPLFMTIAWVSEYLCVYS